jgi:hypothetical protein
MSAPVRPEGPAEERGAYVDLVLAERRARLAVLQCHLKAALAASDGALTDSIARLEAESSLLALRIEQIEGARSSFQ